MSQIQTFIDEDNFSCNSNRVYYQIRCEFPKYKIQSVELANVEFWEYRVQVNGYTIFRETPEDPEEVYVLSEDVYNQSSVPKYIFSNKDIVSLKFKNTWKDTLSPTDTVKFKIILENLEPN